MKKDEFAGCLLVISLLILVGAIIACFWSWLGGAILAGPAVVLFLIAAAMLPSQPGSTSGTSAATSSGTTAAKSFDTFMTEFDEAAGDPVRQRELLRQAANIAKTNIEEFRVATKMNEWNSRYG